MQSRQLRRSSPPSPQPGGPLGKAVALIFFAIFTLGAAGMAVAFVSAGSAFGAAGGPTSGIPMFMAIVPVGFAIIGVLLFIKMAMTPSSQVGTTESPAIEQNTDIPPPAAPSVPIALTCPGCGSRKNTPGATACAYCGGSMTARSA